MPRDQLCSRRRLHVDVQPACRVRKSAAACVSVVRPASTSSLSDCIVASESVPSSRRIAASKCRVPRRRVESIQPHGVVARKERQIILEQHQIAAADHGVGRVNVDDVDFAGQELAIGDVMVDADDVALLQIVAAFQGRPAVAAIEEFVGQCELQLGQPLEIGNPRDSQLRRPLASERQGIRVAEAQRLGHADPFLRSKSRIASRRSTFWPAKISAVIVPVYSG